MDIVVMEEVIEVMLDTEAMDRARERLKLIQDIDAMVFMVMAKERLKLMLSQDIEAMVMVVMEEAMEVKVDTEAMAREGLKLSQVVEAIGVMVMEEVMEVRVVGA